MKKRITAAQRRREDYLRRKGLKVGEVYSSRLARLRKAEARRVLGICKQYDDVSQWARVIENNVSEASYIEGWYTGLYVAAGLPQAKSVARDLSRGKAADPTGIWEDELIDFARRRAGREIVSVSGTMREALIGVVRSVIADDVNIGVEMLTSRILQEFGALLPWQCRRIAQTETMIGLAEAGNAAAQSLDVRFVKEWCISGLGNTRDTHEVMDGVTVDEDEYFILADCQMLYPHDTSLNPPAGEIINCGCSCIRIPK